MTRHYRRDELLAYLDGNDAVVNLAAVTEHLVTCEDCRARQRDVEQELRVLSDPRLWRPSQTRPEPSAERAREYVALHSQVVREDADADAFFKAALAGQSVETWLQRVVDAEMVTAGMVRRITQAGREQEEREPNVGLLMLDVAEQLLAPVDAPEDTKRELAGTIWKERANAREMLGDYAGALQAIDRAETYYETDAVAPYLLAFTKWARANVLYEMTRYREALPLAEQAAATLHAFGDDARELQVRVMIGGISYDQGDIDAALRTWSALLPKLQAAGDDLSVARTIANIGCCYLARFETATAEAYIEEAGQQSRRLGADTEVLRTQWALGRAYVRRGDTAEGIAQLTKVAATFRARGVTVPTAEVELDIIAELLAQARHTEAATMAQSLVTMFVAADTPVNTAQALDYLARAAHELRDAGACQARTACGAAPTASALGH